MRGRRESWLIEDPAWFVIILCIFFFLNTFSFQVRRDRWTSLIEIWRKATATPCSVHDHLYSKLNPDFQFVLSLHSMELHHPFPRHPPASTPPTGKVPLRTDGTPDLLASGTGLDLPSSYLLSRRYLHRWVSVSELNQLLLSVCRSIYVLMSFCATPQRDDYCLFFKNNKIPPNFMTP